MSFCHSQPKASSLEHLPPKGADGEPAGGTPSAPEEKHAERPMSGGCEDGGAGRMSFLHTDSQQGPGALHGQGQLASPAHPGRTLLPFPKTALSMPRPPHDMRPFCNLPVSARPTPGFQLLRPQISALPSVFLVENPPLPALAASSAALTRVRALCAACSRPGLAPPAHRPGPQNAHQACCGPCLTSCHAGLLHSCRLYPLPREPRVLVPKWQVPCPLDLCSNVTAVPPREPWAGKCGPHLPADTPPTRLSPSWLRPQHSTWRCGSTAACVTPVSPPRVGQSVGPSGRDWLLPSPLSPALCPQGPGNRWCPTCVDGRDGPHHQGLSVPEWPCSPPGPSSGQQWFHQHLKVISTKQTCRDRGHLPTHTSRHPGQGAQSPCGILGSSQTLSLGPDDGGAPGWRLH